MMNLPILLLSAVAAPQGHVSGDAVLDPMGGPANATLTATAVMSVDAGWHIYHPDEELGIPTSVKLEGDGFSLVGDFESVNPPKVHSELIGTTTLVQRWLAGKAPFRGQLAVAEVGADGVARGELVVTYQVCNDSVCLPPATMRLPLAYTVGAEVTPATAPARAEPGKAVEIKGKHASGKMFFERASAAVGETVELRIQLTVEDNWHLYAPEQDDEVVGEEIALKVLGDVFTAAGPLRSVTEAYLHTENFGLGDMEYHYLEGEVEVAIPIIVAGELGDQWVPVELFWQPCDPKICDDDEVFTLKVPLTVTEGDDVAAAAAAAAAAAEAARLATSGEGSNPGDGAEGAQEGGPETEGAGPSLINVDPRKALDEGFWMLMWASIAAGLATLLTPCVFPMIPITVSFFTKRAESGKGTALGNASAYAVGIVLTFVGLGLGAAAILGASGANQIASNPWLNLMIAGLFLVLAFSLLGFFEIRPPRFLANFASKAQSEGHAKGGYVPVMVMAFAFSVTAFTCTVGFVGSLLGLAATSGQWWYAAAAMTAYAVVFAMPFFFLAMFPNLLQKMPTAGGWMNAVKVSFGFLEIIAAWKFLSAAERVPDLQILTRPVVIVLTAVPLILWAAYMFGLYTTKGDYGQKPPRSAPRFAIGTLVLALGVYVLSGFPRDTYQYMWMEAYLPPNYYGKQLTEEQEQLEASLPEGISLGPLDLPWHEGWESAMEEGRQANSVVFLDFTGVSCVNCMRMEGNIFPDERVSSLIEQLVRAHLYVDKPPFRHSNTAYELELFQSASQPYYAVMDPKSGEVLSTFKGYDPDPAAFAEFLQKGIDAGATRGLGVLGTK